jgi:membrane-associated phospholipid phosphatase
MNTCLVFLSILLAAVQIVIFSQGFSAGRREGQCADTDISFLHVFDASGKAERSNIPAFAVISSIVSTVPYVVLYVIPLAHLLFYAAKRKITASIMRDGIVSWVALLSNIILKNIFQESRPDGYACISSSTSYGMPSGHATWSVALWVYAYRNGKLSWLGQQYGDNYIWLGAPLWLLAIPLSRYQLQYHTWQQLLVGGAVGLLIGLLAGPVGSVLGRRCRCRPLQKYLGGKTGILVGARLDTVLLWVIFAWIFAGTFDFGKRGPPLLIELGIAVLYMVPVVYSGRNDYMPVPTTEEEKKKTLERDSYNIRL